MQDRKLFELFRKFSAKELKQFSRFLQSPYHNSNKRLNPLFDFLSKFAPDFNHPRLNITTVEKTVFKNEKTDPNAITRLLSELLKKAEQFIITLKTEEDPILAQIDVLKFYEERQLGKLFQQKLKELEKLQNSTGNQDEQFYYREFLIESEKAIHKSMTDDRTGDIGLQDEYNAFLIYANSKLLYQYCQMKLRQQWVNIGYEYLGLENEHNLINDAMLPQIPLIDCLKSAGRLLNSPDTENYYDFKKLLSLYGNRFSKPKLRNFYGMLENGVLRVFNCRSTLYKELFELNEIQIKSGLFVVDGFIQPQVVKNIVTTSLRLKRFAWAKIFLKDHKQYIESDDVYRWNLARLYFHNTEFKKTLGLLEGANINDTFYILGTKRLLLKSYFELGYMDLFFSFLNAFRVFLSRKDLQTDRKKDNQEFLNFVHKMASLAKYDHKKREKLRKTIELEGNVEKEWLLEKLNRDI